MSSRNEIIALRSASMAVEVNPMLGGSIVSASFDDLQILRAEDKHNPAKDPRAAACFPMAPFCGGLPIEGFPWLGRTINPTRNISGPAVAVHGYSWLSSFDSKHESPSEIYLQHDYQGGDWPWTYSLTQHILLEDSGFVVNLQLKNTGTSAAPAGLGLHPFFPLEKQTTVRANVVDELDFRDGLRPAALVIDRALDGWDGTVDITYASHLLRMSVDSPYLNLAMYRPEGSSFFCMEPLTHAMGNAMPNVENGLVNLQPNTVLGLSMRIDVIV